jgi:hypothetical protein
MVERIGDTWTIDKCKSWLNTEVVSGKDTLQQFQARMIAWHVKEYEKAGNPPVLDWADKSLENMQAAIKEMGLTEPKKSLFSKFKEEAK